MGADGLSTKGRTWPGSFAFSKVSELRREVQVIGQVGLTLVRLHLVGSARGAPRDAVLAYTRT